MTPPSVKVCRFVAFDLDDEDGDKLSPDDTVDTAAAAVVIVGKARSVKFSKLRSGKWFSGNGEISSVMRRRVMVWIWWCR